MKVWKLPNSSTTSLIGLVSATSCNIWDAFQNRGWSNVTTGGKLYSDARLQIYRRVEYMHVLSPGYILIIGRKNIDDCPGWSHVCIIPCQFGIGGLKLKDSSHNNPALWFISFSGSGWNSTFWRTWFANLYSIISTCVFSVTCNWDIFFLKTVGPMTNFLAEGYASYHHGMYFSHLGIQCCGRQYQLQTKASLWIYWQ